MLNRAHERLFVQENLISWLTEKQRDEENGVIRRKPDRT